MSIPYRTPGERRLLYWSGWLVAIFASLSYVLLAFAEQGTAGAGLRGVPNDPLPFNRHAGVGVDLTGLSSLQAVEWLEAADVSQVPLVIIPLDGDIIAAFNTPQMSHVAHQAVEMLLAGADDAPVAFCLRRPISAMEEQVLAETAVAVLTEVYAQRITYVGGCIADSSATWETHVLAELDYLPPTSSREKMLAPVSIGAPLRLQNAIAPDDLDETFFDTIGGETYAAVRITPTPGLDEQIRQRIWNLLHDRGQAAVFLAAPDINAPADAFVQSLSFGNRVNPELSEGFNNAISPLIKWSGDWTLTPVGPVEYQRTLTPGSSFTTEFIGTEVWVIGIASPDGGQLGVWVDDEQPDTSSAPDRIIDMERSQARDAAFLAIDGLPATRHTLTLVAAGTEVTVSGLFVTGRTESGIHGTIGSLGLIGAAVAGLAVVLSVAVDDLRLRIGLDRPDQDGSEHPRIFSRDV